MSAELKAVVTKEEGDGSGHHCNMIQFKLFTRKSETNCNVSALLLDIAFHQTLSNDIQLSRALDLLSMGSARTVTLSFVSGLIHYKFLPGSIL